MCSVEYANIPIWSSLVCIDKTDMQICEFQLDWIHIASNNPRQGKRWRERDWQNWNWKELKRGNKCEEDSGCRAGLRPAAVCGVHTSGTSPASWTLQMLDLRSVKAGAEEGSMEAGPCRRWVTRSLPMARHRGAPWVTPWSRSDNRCCQSAPEMEKGKGNNEERTEQEIGEKGEGMKEKKK